MQEILASFYIGKSYGHIELFGKEEGFRTLHYIYVTKDKVIGTFSDVSGGRRDDKTYILEYTYHFFEKCFGIDVEKVMFDRNRKVKLEKIIDNLEG